MPFASAGLVPGTGPCDVDVTIFTLRSSSRVYISLPTRLSFARRHPQLLTSFDRLGFYLLENSSIKIHFIIVIIIISELFYSIRFLKEVTLLKIGFISFRVHFASLDVVLSVHRLRLCSSTLLALLHSSIERELTGMLMKIGFFEDCKH